MAVALLCIGCRVEILHDLDESQANEVLMILRIANIEAVKLRDSRNSERWMISVPKESSALALSVINESELPRAKTDGFKELFRKDSMLPTNLQEKTRYLTALAGELQQTLEEDDQIVIARVHFTLPTLEKDFRSDTHLPGSAAVFLKMIPGADETSSLTDNAIKSLIASSIGGINQDCVTVVRTYAKSLRSSNVPDAKSPLNQQTSNRFFSLCVLILIIVASFAAIWRSVRKIRAEGRRAEGEVSS